MILKRFIRLVLISLGIALAITVINVIPNETITIDLADLAQAFGINFLFAFFITWVNELFFDTLNKWLPWETKSAQRLVFGVLGSVVLTMGVLFVLIGLVQIYIFDSTWERFIEGQSLDWYLSGVLITLFFATVFHAFYFYKELQGIKIKEQKVIAGTATAQFDALKNQLDPHFLFNSLNVLVSLIEENPDAAINFTTSLSKIYRYVLEQRGKDLVPLEEELQFARTYVRLLKMRFEDSLEIAIPNEVSEQDQQIVPLSLQLLIENAVKHNVINSSRPLKLSIYEDQGRLVIENTLQEKAVVQTGTGVGLTNIAARYALLTPAQMQINKTSEKFTVILPLLDPASRIQSKELLMETQAKDKRYIEAQEKVKNLKEFYDECLKTAVILLFLGMLNYFTGGFPWVIFPALGMGIGLFFKYLRNFDRNIFLGKGWEQRKIEELMNDQSF